MAAHRVWGYRLEGLGEAASEGSSPGPFAPERRKLLLSLHREDASYRVRACFRERGWWGCQRTFCKLLLVQIRLLTTPPSMKGPSILKTPGSQKAWDQP